MSKKEPAKSPNKEKQLPPVSPPSQSSQAVEETGPREESVSSAWSIVKEQRSKFEENQRKLKELIDASRFQKDEKMLCQSPKQTLTSPQKLQQTSSTIDSQINLIL